MLNLKPYLDAAQAASTEVLRIANEIDAAFNLGTDEGEQQAMALKSTLDDSQAKAKAALELYESMKKAASTGEAAARFVPVAGAEQIARKKTITLAEYREMTPQARHEFLIKNHGTIEDTLPEE